MHDAGISGATFLVALLYSMVGHGGASGYLAVFALTGMPEAQMKVTALILNLFVAGISFALYRQAKHFDVRLAWPFIVGAAPFTAFASSIKLSGHVYFALVGAALIVAGLRLVWPKATASAEESEPPKVPVGIAVGSGIGLLSGLVGVGGGIFLSPVVMLFRWADAKTAAATSAIFIVTNSLIGLIVRRPDFAKLPSFTPMLIAAGIAGSLLGGVVGTQKLSLMWLQRVLGALLLVASVKLVSGA